MKKFYTILICLTGLLAVSACNTVQGIGKDVKKAGEAVESVGKK
ncbi:MULTISPECIES: entericidin A/B family lipoprotein [unclassified Undibacterium]|nr:MULTISPECIES: entericidin A/B family lipoprotein [unclassified Undibacterium]MEB0216990.1 entericidin A/B family lipoprotein [Undibacterium sp. 5I2]WPX42452.1 entericidin A/B family lipoprotein [Undibacterium sp. CCC3.4]